jgi:hypothetical protein
MFGTALLFAMVSAGIVIALQGLLILRGRRRPRAALFERPLLSALSLKEESQVVQVLGRLRIVYGLFLVVTAIWGLAS